MNNKRVNKTFKVELSNQKPVYTSERSVFSPDENIFKMNI